MVYTLEGKLAPSPTQISEGSQSGIYPPGKRVEDTSPGTDLSKKRLTDSDIGGSHQNVSFITHRWSLPENKDHPHTYSFPEPYS